VNREGARATRELTTCMANSLNHHGREELSPQTVMFRYRLSCRIVCVQRSRNPKRQESARSLSKTYRDSFVCICKACRSTATMNSPGGRYSSITSLWPASVTVHRGLGDICRRRCTHAGTLHRMIAAAASIKTGNPGLVWTSVCPVAPDI